MKRIGRTLAVALVSDGDDADDACEGAAPRRVKELQELVTNPLVLSSLRAHAVALWEAVDEAWAPWLRSIFRSTLGASLRDAIMSLCPQVDEDELVVEAEGVHPGDFETVWVTESAVGGSGALEALYAAYAHDPRRFVRLWHGCLEPSGAERVASSIEEILDSLAGEARSPALVAAVARVRAAAHHTDAIQAVQHLRETLASLGLYVEQATLTILFARVLRPGTSPLLDSYLEATLSRWSALEERAGVAVDARPFALVRARDVGLEEALTTAPTADGEPDQLRSWRYATLLGLLWRRPGSVRRDGLGVGNAFVEASICDRLIVPLPHDASPIIDGDSETWFDELTEALNKSGVARLRVAQDKRPHLAAAVRQLATCPIDTGGLHVFSRIVGYARHTDGIMLTVEMPEALQ